MIIYQVDILLDRGIALVLYSKLCSRLRVDTCGTIKFACSTALPTGYASRHFSSYMYKAYESYLEVTYVLLFSAGSTQYMYIIVVYNFFPSLPLKSRLGLVVYAFQ